MPSLNFKKRFVPMILEGRKRHTIRAKRKRPIRVGQMLYLFTGLRTKHVERLMESECRKVEDIKIVGPEHEPKVLIEDFELDRDERERLAYADGFECFRDMAAFWKGRIPFHGDIIHW